MAEWSPTYVAARAGRDLEGMLARGFTTIRDAGGGDFGLAQAVEEGYFTGPRIRYGGKQLTQTGERATGGRHSAASMTTITTHRPSG